MSKTFEQVAMAVVREDWELRKEENNPGFSQERIAQLMGISRSQLAKALTMDKNPTISFLCSYATAVGRPLDEFLHTIGLREAAEQRSQLISNQLSRKREIEII
jgi:transcriptional regulator with XRE-family HTH domain